MLGIGYKAKGYRLGNYCGSLSVGSRLKLIRVRGIIAIASTATSTTTSTTSIAISIVTTITTIITTVITAPILFL